MNKPASDNQIDEPATHKIIGILLLHTLLTIGYGLVNPIFEAPDEHHHYFTVTQIKACRCLLVIDEANQLARQEAAQPPLYYIIGALLLAPVETSATTPDFLWFNPYVQLGDATTADNNNVFIHTAAEAWPWRDDVLGVHLLRLFSTLLGVITLFAIWKSGRLIWPHHPARPLIATALVAFLPQFSFLHASVSNDPLVITLASLALWQLLRIWLREPTCARLIWLGVTVGLAMLAKTAGLLLLIFCGGWLLLMAIRNHTLAPLWPHGWLLFLPALAIGGWLFVRNWLLYSDPTAANQFIALAGGDRHFTLAQVATQLNRVWLSFVAFFGWMTVRPPSWLHAIWLGLLGLSLTGSIWQLWQKRQSVRWLLLAGLAGWPLLVVAGWVQFMLRTSAEQGRLLFPTLLPLALATTFGLSQWPRWLTRLALALAFTTSAFAMLFVIPAAYERPATLTTANLPNELIALNQNLSNTVQLVGINLTQTTVSPGQPFTLDLFWTSPNLPTEPPVVVITLLGRELELVGKLHSYHGNGRFPATLWQPNTIYRDRVTLLLNNEARTPTQARIFVELLDEQPSIEIGSIKLVPQAWPTTDETPLAQLGEGVQLLAANPSKTAAAAGETITVNLRWQITTSLGRDFITFVHLGDPTLQPLAQGDALALSGDYPPRLWEAGELFDDAYSLTLPAELANGRYPLNIGLYDPETGQRLPLSINNVPQPNDAFTVDFITIQN